MRFLGCVTIKSQDRREVSAGGGSGASRLSTSANTHFSKMTNGRVVNLGPWRKRNVPIPLVVENNVPSTHQKGKSVVKMGIAEQNKGLAEEEEVRKAKEERGVEENKEEENKAIETEKVDGWGVIEGKRLLAKFAEEQKPVEAENPTSKEPASRVREVSPRKEGLEIDTFITNTCIGPLGPSGNTKVQPPGIQQHPLHLPPPTCLPLYGEDLPQQLAQSCSCGNTSVPHGAQEAGVIEEAPVSVYILDHILLT